MMSCIGHLMLWAALVGWQARAGAGFDVMAIVFSALLLLGSWSTGYVLVRGAGLYRWAPGLESTVPRYALGMPLLIVITFVVSMALPWQGSLDGLVVIACMLGLAAWVAYKHQGATESLASGTNRGHGLDTVFIACAIVLVSLWCRDVIGPMRVRGDHVEIRAWGDVYYHLSQISRMAVATSLGHLQDIQMAGSHAQPYHLAGYALPAALVSAAQQSAWVAYSGLFVPFGLLLTCLAAYTLVLPFLGRRVALCAGLGLLLLPDAAQMGMGLKFLGYHWMQQVGPAGMYGVAASAAALLLMMLACQHGRFAWLGLVALFAACVLLLKAQIFVALAFPLVVMPALFFKDWAMRWRVLALVASVSIFMAAVQVGQLSTSVPLMRLDGSGLAPYSQMLLNMQSGGWLKRWALSTYPAGGHPWLQLAAAFLPVLMLGTFGLHLFSLVWATTGRGARHVPPLTRWVPCLIVVNYAVMAMGLALDDRHIGMPEELVQRPFVWAYFIVVTFSVALIWHRWYGDAFPVRRGHRVVWCILLCLLVAVPLHFGKRIQTMPSWGRGYETLPVCLYEATQFIRSHSPLDAVIQDQEGDRTFAVTALSERASWAVDSGGFRMPPGLPERIRSAQTVASEPDPRRALQMLSASGIDWYVASASDKLQWLDRIDKAQHAHVAFSCGQVAVIQVPRRADQMVGASPHQDGL